MVGDRFLTDLTKEQKQFFYETLDRSISTNWKDLKIITKEEYICDFGNSIPIVPNDFEWDVNRYFECLSDITESMFYNSKSWGLVDYSGRQLFAGLEKSSLESSYRNYLSKEFFSEAIELTVLMAFLGHEYEVFLLEMSKQNLSFGLFSRWINPVRVKAIESVPILSNHLKQLYETVLSPQPSLELLKIQILSAREKGCYINPCVQTIIERCEERGIKRFRNRDKAQK